MGDSGRLRREHYDGVAEIVPHAHLPVGRFDDTLLSAGESCGHLSWPSAGCSHLARGVCASTARARGSSGRAERRARTPPGPGVRRQDVGVRSRRRRSRGPSRGPTRSLHSRRVCRSRARCGVTSSKTPKCGSASRAGWRRSISSSERSQSSRSMSGGGVGARTKRAALDADARDVAGEHRSVGGEVRHMVARVARASESTSSPRTRLADDVDVLRGNRSELAPERVEGVAVETAGARVEPTRVEDVRSARRRRRVPGAPAVRRTSTPAAPAWSRWMWVGADAGCRRAPGRARPSPARDRGRQLVGPQSTRPSPRRSPRRRSRRRCCIPR